MMPTKQAPSPAHALMLKRRNDEYTALRKMWKKDIPQGWITRFIEDGLLPLLKARGYNIGYSPLSASRYCSEWASNHVLVKHYKNENLVIVHNNDTNKGGQEELDWFFHNIPTYDWITLCERWATNQFLDDSEVGYEQQNDLPYFAWKLVSLDTSRAHQKYLDWAVGDDWDNPDSRFSHYEENTYSGGYDGERK